MFDFFKKKNEPLLYAPLEGKCIPLEEVPDKVFAQKMMGDGVAFIPASNQVFAPCDASVSMIATTKHAIGLVNDDGVEILIHIGLDTVNFQGKGFEVHVKKQQRVRKGELIVTFDKEFFEKENVNLTTPMILTNHTLFNLEVMNINQSVRKTDAIIRYEKKS